jgi:hypothetical protein
MTYVRRVVLDPSIKQGLAAMVSPVKWSTSRVKTW